MGIPYIVALLSSQTISQPKCYSNYKYNIRKGDILYTYSTKRHKTPIKVSQAELLLLKVIGSLGFVNNFQLNMIWSVIQHYPANFPKSTLTNWCSFDGLIKVIKRSSDKKKSSVIRTTYKLTNSANKWLNDLNVLVASDDSMSVNSHNEQAVEVVVQGLYSACFKHKLLGVPVPYLENKDFTVLLNLGSLASNWCNEKVEKSEIKGERLNNEKVNKGEIRISIKKCKDIRLRGEDVELKGKSKKEKGIRLVGEKVKEKYSEEICSNEKMKKGEERLKINVGLEQGEKRYRAKTQQELKELLCETYKGNNIAEKYKEKKESREEVQSSKKEQLPHPNTKKQQEKNKRLKEQGEIKQKQQQRVTNKQQPKYKDKAKQNTSDSVSISTKREEITDSNSCNTYIDSNSKIREDNINSGNTISNIHRKDKDREDISDIDKVDIDKNLEIDNSNIGIDDIDSTDKSKEKTEEDSNKARGNSEDNAFDEEKGASCENGKNAEEKKSEPQPQAVQKHSTKKTDIDNSNVNNSNTDKADIDKTNVTNADNKIVDSKINEDKIDSDSNSDINSNTDIANDIDTTDIGNLNAFDNDLDIDSDIDTTDIDNLLNNIDGSDIGNMLDANANTPNTDITSPFSGSSSPITNNLSTSSPHLSVASSENSNITPLCTNTSANITPNITHNTDINSPFTNKDSHITNKNTPYTSRDALLNKGLDKEPLNKKNISNNIKSNFNVDSNCIHSANFKATNLAILRDVNNLTLRDVRLIKRLYNCISATFLDTNYCVFKLGDNSFKYSLNVVSNMFQYYFNLVLKCFQAGFNVSSNHFKNDFIVFLKHFKNGFNMGSSSFSCSTLSYPLSTFKATLNGSNALSDNNDDLLSSDNPSTLLQDNDLLYDLPLDDDWDLSNLDTDIGNLHALDNDLDIDTNITNNTDNNSSSDNQFPTLPFAGSIDPLDTGAVSMSIGDINYSFDRDVLSKEEYCEFSLVLRDVRKITFCFPKTALRLNTYYEQLADEEKGFLNELANLVLYVIALDNVLAMSDNNKAILCNSKYKDTLNNPLRSFGLIANSNFDLSQYDLRSFKRQLGMKFGESLPFVADMMISFDSKNNRRKEFFVELDNRTEGNATQIQKIMSYIWYALDNPDKDIAMVIAITDGSLSSRQVPAYTNIGRKLGNIAQVFLQSTVTGDDGRKYRLLQLYQVATNLHIYVSGVSESYIDVAHFLLGGNYLSDYLYTIDKLIDDMATKTGTVASFQKSQNIVALEQQPTLLATSERNLTIQPQNNQSKGIFRYLPQVFDNYKVLGTLTLRDFGTKDTRQITLIAGDEHELDTLIAQTFIMNGTEYSNAEKPFICIYPQRIIPKTAISTSDLANSTFYMDSFLNSMPYYLQPLCAISHDVQLHEELRWVTIQYAKEIYSYFKNGAINQTALKKGISYANTYVPLLSTVESKPRTYQNLQKLAQTMSQNDFVSQLSLDEIPKELYLQLIERWPDGYYCINGLTPLPYVQNPITQKALMPCEHYDFIDFIHPLNSMLPLSRNKITW